MHTLVYNNTDTPSFPYPDTDPEAYSSHVGTYFHLFIPPCPTQLGYLLPSVALTLQGIPGWTLNEKDRTLTLNLPEIPTPAPETKEDTTETIHDATTTEETPPTTSAEQPAQPNEPTLESLRTALIARTTAAMRATDHFAVLRKWRDELYPIYYHDPLTQSTQLLASIERSASALFGVVTYGVHCTCFTTSPGGDSGGFRGWVRWVVRVVLQRW